MTNVRDQLEAARALVRQHVPVTPFHNWPLLSRRTGCDVWVKHENHTPIGAFKIRGGLVYFHRLLERLPNTSGVVAATRGNHGQSIAFAARKHGISADIVVPHGNSSEKNAAMEALGAQLHVHGEDFQEALEYAEVLAAKLDLHMLPSFHEDLVIGVASYSLEVMELHEDIDTMYVPIGLGSGICGAVLVRDALNLKTRIVGVVAENAPAYALSFDAGRSVSTNSAATMADGVACRVPDADALLQIRAGVERIVTVSEAEIEAAISIYFSDTHNLAEGAGAAAFAALLKERDQLAACKIAVVLSGGNIDRNVYQDVLSRHLDG